MASVMTAKKKKYEDCPYNEACKNGHSERIDEAEREKYDTKVRCHDCNEVKYTPKAGTEVSEPAPSRRSSPAQEEPAEAPA